MIALVIVMIQELYMLNIIVNKKNIYIAVTIVELPGEKRMILNKIKKDSK